MGHPLLEGRRARDLAEKEGIAAQQGQGFAGRHHAQAERLQVLPDEPGEAILRAVPHEVSVGLEGRRVQNEIEAPFTDFREEALQAARVVAVPVGENEHLHLAQVRIEGVGVEGRPVLREAEIEQDRSRPALAAQPDKGRESVLGQDGIADQAVPDVPGPPDDVAVVHGRDVDVVVLEGKNLHPVEFVECHPAFR